jgi:hypothetical protein
MNVGVISADPQDGHCVGIRSRAAFRAAASFAV